MISYLLVTKHDISLSWDVIESILCLPEHDKEIIICCPEDKIIDDDRFVWVIDDKCTGSPYAFNKAYWNSKGDYIATIIDDIILPSNFLDMLDFMNSDFMSKKKYKISNTMWDGGPGLFNYGHPHSKGGTDMWTIDKCHPLDIKHCPYSVIPLPFFERKTVEQYLSGYLFNPRFKNHYIDHWLGYFLCKNEKFEPHKWRCPKIHFIVAQNRKPIEINNDEYDKKIFKTLVNGFIKGKTNYV